MLQRPLQKYLYKLVQYISMKVGTVPICLLQQTHSLWANRDTQDNKHMYK